MNTEEYERMYHLEDSYWWFQGRLAIIRSLLAHFIRTPPRKGRVLDVGCGTGLMLNSIRHWEPVGIDFSRLALDYTRRRGVRKVVQGDVVHLPFADSSMDIILALDLMEHVERDDLLIREFNRILRPGGWLMATVPAHPSLWSDHDIALHHYRRYTWNSFRSLLREGDFHPLKLSYAIFFMHPLIVTFRLIQKLWQSSISVEPRRRPKTHLIPLPQPINAALIGILKIESVLLRRLRLPMGTSLLVLAQKRNRTQVRDRCPANG